MNWVAAALKCKDLDSQLAILNSKEEDTFVEGSNIHFYFIHFKIILTYEYYLALLIPDKRNKDGWFLGAQDIDNAFNFLWIDGTPSNV